MSTTREIMVRLRANVTDFQQEMGKAATSLDQVVKRSGDASGAANTTLGRLAQSAKHQSGAWREVGGTLATAGGAVTAFNALIAKTGGSYNVLQQKSRAALGTILGSTAAASAQMDKLDEWAKGSPFGKDIFIAAQQQMLGFGIETQKVIPYLDALNDAVAATGGSGNDIAELSLIFSQIQAAAKITATDLMQFAQRGVDAATLIGDQMGMTGAEIREAITAGTLDAGEALDALAAGMKDRYGGASAAVKETFAGAFDRVKAAWRDLSSAMMEPLISANGGGALVDMTNQFADMLRAIEALPGPTKTAIGALSGLTGLGLLGTGSILMAIPKFVELHGALSQLAEISPRAASGLGMLGRAIPVAGTFLAVAAAATALNAAFTPIPATADEVAAAVQRAADAASEWDDVFAVDDDGKWMASPLGNIDSMEEALHRIAAIPLEERSIFHSDQYEDIVAAEEQLRKVDAALQNMSGDKAAKATASLVQQMQKAKISSGEIGRLLPESAAKAEDALYRLSLAGADVQVNADGVADLLAGKLPAGAVFTAEGIMTVYEATQKGVEGFDMLGREVVKSAESQEQAVAATAEAAEAYGDLSLRSEMVRSAIAEVTASMDGEAASAEDVAKAVEEAEQAHARLIGELSAADSAFVNIGGTIEKFTKDAKFNLGGYLDALEKQVEAQSNWEQNMIVLADRASEGLLDHLARLGPEGAPLVAALVDASDAELQRMETVFAQSAADATGAWAVEFANARGVWAALAAQNGQAAVDAAKEKVRAGKATLGDIVSQYNLAFDLDADTDPAIRGAHAAAAEISRMRAVIRVSAMLTGNPAAMYAAGMYGRAGGGLIGDRGEFHLAAGGMPRQSFAGRMVYGPGTKTSDSIPARLSLGEFVQRAAAVDYYGPKLMYALNAMRIPREYFAALGYAGGGSPRYEYAPSMPPPIQPGPQRPMRTQPPQITQTNNIVESHKPELTARVLGERLMGVMGR